MAESSSHQPAKWSSLDVSAMAGLVYIGHTSSHCWMTDVNQRLLCWLTSVTQVVIAGWYPEIQETTSWLTAVGRVVIAAWQPDVPAMTGVVDNCHPFGHCWSTPGCWSNYWGSWQLSVGWLGGIRLPRVGSKILGDRLWAWPLEYSAKIDHFETGLWYVNGSKVVDIMSGWPQRISWFHAW